MVRVWEEVVRVWREEWLGCVVREGGVVRVWEEWLGCGGRSG